MYTNHHESECHADKIFSRSEFENILRFAIRLAMMVHHHGLECLVECLACCLSVQGDGEDSNPREKEEKVSELLDVFTT